MQYEFLSSIIVSFIFFRNGESDVSQSGDLNATKKIYLKKAVKKKIKSNFYCFIFN